MTVRNVPMESAGPLVRDAMLKAPSSVAPDLTVEAARFMLVNPRLRMLLVADGDSFRGAVSRERLEAALDGSTTVGELAGAERDAVTPDEPLERALEILAEQDSERLPVVTADNRLVGLVCFNRRKGHFCIDAD